MTHDQSVEGPQSDAEHSAIWRAQIAQCSKYTVLLFISVFAVIGIVFLIKDNHATLSSLALQGLHVMSETLSLGGTVWFPTIVATPGVLIGAIMTCVGLKFSNDCPFHVLGFRANRVSFYRGILPSSPFLYAAYANVEKDDFSSNFAHFEFHIVVVLMSIFTTLLAVNISFIFMHRLIAWVDSLPDPEQDTASPSTEAVQGDKQR